MNQPYSFSMLGLLCDISIMLMASNTNNSIILLDLLPQTYMHTEVMVLQNRSLQHCSYDMGGHKNYGNLNKPLPQLGTQLITIIILCRNTQIP